MRCALGKRERALFPPGEDAEQRSLLQRGKVAGGRMGTARGDPERSLVGDTPTPGHLEI